MTGSGPFLPEARYGLSRRIAAKRLFRSMISRQQISLASVRWRESEEIIFRALHTCSHCTAKAACAAWLASAEPPMRYVRFCPNAEAIEALRIMAE